MRFKGENCSVYTMETILRSLRIPMSTLAWTPGLFSAGSAWSGGVSMVRRVPEALCLRELVC